MVSKLERDFQKDLIKEIKQRFPNSVVTKNNPNYIQGILDLTVFNEDKWAMLECKKSANADFQPNQEYYIESFNKMSYAAAIYPDNKEKVLNELQEHFGKA